MLNISPISPQLKNVEKNLSPPLIERIMDILSSRLRLKPKEKFLLEYVQLIVYFRVAIMGKRKTIVALSKALDCKEEEGKRFGFSKEELRRLNIHVRDNYPTEWSLNELVNSITARLRQN